MSYDGEEYNIAVDVQGGGLEMSGPALGKAHLKHEARPSPSPFHAPAKRPCTSAPLSMFTSSPDTNHGRGREKEKKEQEGKAAIGI